MRNPTHYVRCQQCGERATRVPKAGGEEGRESYAPCYRCGGAYARIVRRACLDCGAPVHALSHLDYCKPCGWRHCDRCGRTVKSTGKRRLCGPCMVAAREAEFAGEGRRCACGAPIPAGRRSVLCTACHTEEGRLYRKALACRKDARCRRCGLPIPGRQYLDCAACRMMVRRALPRRPCATCGVQQRVVGSSYCRACDSIRRRWQQAYRAGDPGARALKTKRTNRSTRWKEKKPKQKEGEPSSMS